MVIPIWPNTEYQRDRDPIVSTPPFPFSNCFFWLQSNMSLRVRARHGLYDNDQAIKLDAFKRLRLEHHLLEDSRDLALRRKDLIRQRITAPNFDEVHGVLLYPPKLRVFSYDAEDDNPRSPFASDPMIQYIPLVDIWLNIEDHLSPDNIPSPTEFWMEQEQIDRSVHLHRCPLYLASSMIHRIIEEAHLRRKAAAEQQKDVSSKMTVHLPPQHLSPSSTDSESSQSSSLVSPTSAVPANSAVLHHAPPSYATIVSAHAPLDGKEVATWSLRSAQQPSPPTSCQVKTPVKGIFSARYPSSLRPRGDQQPCLVPG